MNAGFFKNFKHKTVIIVYVFPEMLDRDERLTSDASKQDDIIGNVATRGVDKKKRLRKYPEQKTKN
jgi:hypothetical protein